MDLDSIKPDQILDAKGLSCPMPLLRTKKAINSIASGQILEVLGTDPGSKNDLPSWCERSGHNCLGAKDDVGFFHIFIKKG
ncbi:MAG: sulfurtransferase TusA family protein [Proteobacteria bacterium]|nr:sulfurtransferase TusA family protein [Pseudomonadota bacterium]MBU1137710.1 sulfurtransferase TusA family protein [Pseudomonadota bacterium]MBU1233016.1 sulfurtransferase TusA family protein [Pseudomonadota bacterium]MBU1419187.1 sulfurtransferase TusA family protein [Pseudomonadota bacterium]MBU1455285.1 sulfurtransferase TusA family protein [Pseudomonadota bacterium]